MKPTLFENLQPLLPVDFFEMGLDITLNKKLDLPDTSDLLGEASFGDLTLLLKQDGIHIQATVKKPFEECFYPDYEKGDCLELFFDTRDLKTAGFMTRFCHHFLILPVEVQGITSREVTQFRTEDTHPLCDPADLEVQPDFSSSRYQLNIFIPAHCLHGYDPLSFKRLGFTYRLNRFQGEPQHFSVSSRNFNIVQHPSLWASLQIKG